MKKDDVQHTREEEKKDKKMLLSILNMKKKPRTKEKEIA